MAIFPVIMQNKIFIITLIAYLVLAFIFLPYFRYQTDTDGVSNIAEAQKIAAGNFAGALNASWPPTFPLTIALFLACGLSPIPAARIALILTGLFLFFAVRSLSYRFELTELTRNLVYFILIPVTLYIALFTIKSDLLFAIFVIYYFSYIFKPDYTKRVGNTIICGVFASLAYLTKSYALLFFILNFSVLSLFYFIKNYKTSGMRIVINTLTGAAVFLLIVILWNSALYTKYHQVMIGKVADYNWRALNPNHFGQPMHNEGLLPPPDNASYSSLDDFTILTDLMPQWSPFESKENLKYTINRIVANTITMFGIYESFTFLWIFILFAYFLICLFPVREFTQKEETLPFLSVILFPLGYLPLIIFERYLLPVNILLLLMGAHLLTLLLKSKFFTKSRKIALISLFTLSFVIPPPYFIHHLKENKRNYTNVYNISRVLKEDYGVGGNIASFNNWWDGVTISFYLNSRYYGESGFRYRSAEEFYNDLIKYKINYYLVWGQSPYDKWLKNTFEHFSVRQPEFDKEEIWVYRVR